MKVVIDINDELYNEFMDGKDIEIYVNGEFSKTIPEVGEWIRNGVKLPKGHGDLKDIDAINLYEEDYYEGADYVRVIDAIVGAPTVIEADKENKDGSNNN